MSKGHEGAGESAARTSLARAGERFIQQPDEGARAECQHTVSNSILVALWRNAGERVKCAITDGTRLAGSSTPI